MYILLLISAPHRYTPQAMARPLPPSSTTTRQVATPPPDTVYIPKIGVAVRFAAGGSEVLERGAWHRNPTGNPVTGGNFILSAHRFELGLTPQHTKAKSPFYNLNKLRQGDDIAVDYQGQRYAYQVDKVFSVSRTAFEIEAPSPRPILTLYSCDIRGEQAGRLVVRAVPVP